MAPEIVGALAAQGLQPAEQSVSIGFAGAATKTTLGNAIKLPPLCACRGAGIIAALAPLRRPPTRQSVAPLPEDAAAKFFLVRGLHNLFLLSAHDHEAITSARGDAKETQRS